MSVRLLTVNPPCTSVELEQIAAELIDPPDDYMAFMKEHNGGQLEPNEFKNTGAGVKNILDVPVMLSTSRNLKGRIPKDSWPIADAEGGNFILLRRIKNRWRIDFWDHETEEAQRLTGTFGALMNDLMIVEPPSTARVLSAWVDPEFLASLKNK